MVAIAPVLILIGASMIGTVKNIEWDNLSIAIPAFFTIVIMPFTYSIPTGIEIGLFFYLIASIVNKDSKKVSPIIYIFVILFIIDFIYKALFQG